MSQSDVPPPPPPSQNAYNLMNPPSPPDVGRHLCMTPIKILKFLLPSCCQEKIRPEKISFKSNGIKCIDSVYFFLLKSQFTLIIGFTNFEIDMTGEFLLL